MIRREGLAGFSANVDLVTGVEVEYYLPDEEIVFIKTIFLLALVQVSCHF